MPCWNLEFLESGLESSSPLFEFDATVTCSKTNAVPATPPPAAPSKVLLQQSVAVPHERGPSTDKQQTEESFPV